MACSRSHIAISPDRYLAHINILAHDQFEGRGTGSNGIDLAAGYIAGQFAAIGLQPGGPNGTYFQDFTIPGDAKLLDETSLEVRGLEPLHQAEPAPAGGVASEREVDHSSATETEPSADTDVWKAVLREDFVPYGFSAKGDMEGDVVFVGYGITNSASGHDDYAGIDVTGKVVLMLRLEPRQAEGQGGFSEHSRFDRKTSLAKERGAKGVMVVNQRPENEDDEDDLERFRSRGETYGLPVIQLTRRIGNQMLTAAGMPDLAELQRRIDEDRANVSAVLPSVSIKAHVAYESNEMKARNVLGLLRANGSHPDEYVVIGAHYDHLGIRRQQIHNGADDNASGTSGVIELARSFVAMPKRDRSLIFMTFSGEELGLHGSDHYAQNPTVPITSIVAMINMDMIGRLNTETEANMLAIQGLGTGGNFAEIVRSRTEEMGFKYLPDDSAKGPSDHASFDAVGVPSLFFFTGLHPDYHAPGDDVEKINAVGGARISQLVGSIAADIVNSRSAPKFAKVDKRAVLPGRSSHGDSGPVMGILPDFEDESPQAGWRIAQVFPGGGAAKAGMKDGDRIMAVNGKAITSFGDYQEATAGKKAGDVIPVTVKRGQEEIMLSVELAARGQQ